MNSRIGKSAEASGRHYKKIELQSDLIPLVRAADKIYEEIQESLNNSISTVLDLVSAWNNGIDYRSSNTDKAGCLDPRYKGKRIGEILIKEIKEKLTANMTMANLRIKYPKRKLLCP